MDIKCGSPYFFEMYFQVSHQIKLPLN